MTTLTDHLVGLIRASGPITLATYMETCLTHPRLGYYTTRDAIGGAGDFVTAPEISQMFGELLGLCLAQAWLTQGAPREIVLAEAGPGHGTLMADLLRATRAVPGFHDAMTLHLVEVSPVLREMQAAALGEFNPTWHASISDLPLAPTFLVANEFFDALPIRQFRRGGDLWRETVIGIDSAGALCLALSPPCPLPLPVPGAEETPDGGVVEFCPSAMREAGVIGARMAAHGGAAIIVDYGAPRSQGDTFQAVRGHDKVSVLDSPGKCDLTAHVAFEPLAEAAATAGAGHTALVPQGVFLERLGITARAQALARNLSGAALEQHISAHRRLTHPDEMGDLFKVMAFHGPGTSPPPGFEE